MSIDIISKIQTGTPPDTNPKRYPDDETSE